MEITFEQLPSVIATLVKQVTNIERILSEKKETTPDSDQLLTIQQAGELLKLSVPTIYGLVSRSEIPVCKRGKRLYFSKQELMQWIKAGRKMTLSEINNETDNYLAKQKK